MPTQTHEQTINTSLGEVLQDFGQGWRIRSEHVGKVFEEGGRPDILIEKSDGWPVVLEAEVGNHRQAEIERRFLPGYLTEWIQAEADKRQQAETMALYRHQVDLIRRMAPEFRQAYRQALTGCDEFYFQGGKVRLSSSGTNAHLELSLSFDELVRVLMFLHGQAQ